MLIERDESLWLGRGMKCGEGKIPRLDCDVSSAQGNKLVLSVGSWNLLRAVGQSLACEIGQWKTPLVSALTPDRKEVNLRACASLCCRDSPQT